MSPLLRNEFKEVLDKLSETGINLSKLSKEVGLNENAFSSAKERGAIFGDIIKLANKLKGKAALLKKSDLKQYSLDYILSSCLMKESYIARILGISRQGLNKQKKMGTEAPRADEIQAILKKAGKEIESLSFRLEKIRH